MSYTKRQFIYDAYQEIGIANYAYDLQPEQLQTALRRLDSMMATWNSKGIRVGYPIPTSPENSDLDDETNVPDAANEAIVLNLSIRLAPGLGKVVLPETKKSAREAYTALLVHTHEVVPMKYPDTLPSGAGNKSYRNGVFIETEEDLNVNNGVLNFE